MKKHCKRHNSGSATQKLNDLGSHSSFEDIVQTNLGITDFPGVAFFLCFAKALLQHGQANKAELNVYHME